MNQVTITTDNERKLQMQVNLLTDLLVTRGELLDEALAERDTLAGSDARLREEVGNLQQGLEHYRDQWSEVCNYNQGLIKERDALHRNRHAREDVISGLRDDTEALTKERDAYSKAADDMAAAHKVERDALTERVKALEAAAQAVIDRWDTPMWKEAHSTAIFIASLNAAIKGTP